MQNLVQLILAEAAAAVIAEQLVIHLVVLEVLVSLLQERPMFVLSLQECGI